MRGASQGVLLGTQGSLLLHSPLGCNPKERTTSFKGFPGSPGEGRPALTASPYGASFPAVTQEEGTKCCQCKPVRQ